MGRERVGAALGLARGRRRSRGVGTALGKAGNPRKARSVVFNQLCYNRERQGLCLRSASLLMQEGKICCLQPALLQPREARRKDGGQLSLRPSVLCFERRAANIVSDQLLLSRTGRDRNCSLRCRPSFCFETERSHPRLAASCGDGALSLRRGVGGGAAVACVAGRRAGGGSAVGCGAGRPAGGVGGWRGLLRGAPALCARGVGPGPGLAGVARVGGRGAAGRFGRWAGRRGWSGLAYPNQQIPRSSPIIGSYRPSSVQGDTFPYGHEEMKISRRHKYGCIPEAIHYPMRR
ncbi:hypothetical protein GOBAR_DD31323 [Gossypium barbadense]|nr:hypothetical protein GOBAR_DD31323 [Gossypium barbadense]